MISRLGLVVNIRVEFPTLQILGMEGRVSNIHDIRNIISNNVAYICLVHLDKVPFRH